nr:DMT family transporter [Paenibacillus agaridevorans]
MNVVCICSWSSICFGIRGILYQWTSQRPVDRNLLLCGVYVSGALIAFTMNLFVGNHWTNGVWFGVLMGLFSFIANGSMYKGFAVGKASVIALFTGLPPLVVVTSAYLLWRESLNPLQLIGFSIVLIGILTIRYANDLKQGQFVGWQWGILTMLFFGFTDVSSKQATIAAAETLPVLTVMYGTGSLCFAFLMMRCRYSRKKMMSDNGAERSAQRSEVASANQQAQKGWTSRRTFLWGMVVGISNIVGMIFVVPAFRDGVTGIVSAISAMNVLIVLLYVQFYLKENLSKREISGIAVTLAGILLIRLAT